MNFYKHHIGDYDSATAHLLWGEDMAYTRMLRLYYRREGPLPADFKQLCRLIRAGKKEERFVQVVLDEFFTLKDDGWHNPRADEEILIAQDRAEKSREVGKKGGRPRKTETQDSANNTVQGNLTETQKVSENNPEGLHKETQKVSEINLHARGTNSQTPDSRLQTTDIKTLPPGSSQPQPQPSAAPRKRAATVQGKPVSLSGETWEAYSRAYETRYGVPPVRNATVNGQLSNFVRRIGHEEAPRVAEFYVRHPAQFYARTMHSIGTMVRDAEKLRTEWATGKIQTEHNGHGKNQREGNQRPRTPAERVRANYPDVFGPEGEGDDEFGRLINVTPTNGGHLG